MVSNRSLTEKEFTEKLDYFTNHNFKAISKFVRRDEKIEFQCKRCNTILVRVPDNMLRYKDKEKCPTCLKIQDIEKHVEGREGYTLINIEKIKGNKTFINVLHEVCNMQRRVQFDGFKRVDRGCPHCKNNLKMNLDSLKFKINEKFGDEFEVVSKEYKNNKNKMTFRHIKCGKEFLSSSNNLLYNGVCPHCFPRSKGEEFIKNYLENNDIDYTQEYSIEKLVNKKKLRFDFFLNDLNLFIEFDGKQHFIDDKKSFMTRDYEDRIIRDKIKNKFCLENNLKLIRIPYYEYDNLKEILDKIIKEECSTTIESYNILLINEGKYFNEKRYYNE